MINQSVSLAAMEKALQGSWQRIQVIGNNIVNQDTPGYKAKRVSFEAELQRQLTALKAGRPEKSRAIRQIQAIAPRVYEDGGLTVKADGNNVNINSEQIELARTQLQYEALGQRIDGYYAAMKMAVRGGR